MADGDDYDSPWNSWNGQQSVVNCASEAIGVSSSLMDPNKSFYENGGSSLTALSSLLELRKQGHSLTIEEFLGANSIKSAANASLAPTINSLENNLVFIKTDIKDIPQDEAAKLIAECFVKKGDLERCRDDLKPEHFEEVVRKAWNLIQKYSFGFRDEAGKLRALATSIDIADENLLTMEGLHPHLQNVFPYLSHITEEALNQVPDAHLPGVMLEKFLFGTAVDNSPIENILLMNMMVREFHERAAKAGYKVSIAQNASPLTQQLAELLGCKRFLTDNPREYVNDKGERPFIHCADSIRITVDMMFYPSRS